MFSIKSFTFSPIQENTYVLHNENSNAIIIDPGCYFDDEKNVLVNFIVENNLTVKYLLNTHCHLDHVFGNKFVAEKFDLIPHIHPLEETLLEYAPTSGLMWNLPFDNYSGELIFINEDEQIILDDDILDIIHCPGHSPGSICFYSKPQGFIISGDVLFKNSIGRTDLPRGDFETLKNSIQQKMYKLLNETVVYSGHGEPTSISYEKKNNEYIRPI